MRIATLSLCLALAACADPTDHVGSIDVAIVSNVGDTTYTLTDGAQLRLESGTFHDTFDLGGDVHTITVDVPVGTYQATLIHPFGFTDTWPLYRSISGGATETVWATLVTPMPLTVDVSEGSSSSVVLTFHVVGSEPITFGYGSIDVSAEVDEVPANGATITTNGLASVQTATFYNETPEALFSRLPDNGSSGHNLGVAGTVGTWQQRSSTSACASLLIFNVSPDGHAGFADLLLESSGTLKPQPSVGEVCVTKNGLEITLAQASPGLTPTFADLDADMIDFKTFLSIPLDELVIFDGHTLDLAALDGVHGPLPFTGSMSVSSYGVDWYSNHLTGTLSIDFRPTE